MKRIISSLMSIVLFLSVFNLTVKANVQLPIEEFKVLDVSANKGYHPITGEALISPQVTIEWKDPGNWDTGSGTGQDAVQHNPERYIVEIRNATTGLVERTANIPYDATNQIKEVDLHDFFGFLPGTLYEISVIPEHSHINLAGDDVPIRPPYNESLYVLTDLEVSLETTDNSIDVTWTDVDASNISYKITYAQMDYNDSDPRSKFESSSKKYEFIITEDMTVKDTVNKKLKYSINENIEPGKPYAITVTPIIDIPGKTVAFNPNPSIYTCHTTIYFNVIDEGDYIRFEWNISDNFKLNDGDYKLINTAIYEYVNGATEGQTIVQFPGTNGANVNYYRIEKKEGVTLEYQLKLEYDGYSDEVTSNKILYVPNEIVIKPTKPVIPEPMTEELVEQLENYLDGGTIEGSIGDILNHYTKLVSDGGLGLSKEAAVERLLVEKYLIDGDFYEAEKLDTLLSENRTFHIMDNEKAFNLVWSAFRYEDYTTTSPTYGEVITDYNVYYDIWVSDDFNQLTTTPKIESDLKIDPTLDFEDVIYNEDGDSVGFSHYIDTYYKQGVGILDIVPGQVYYVQIIAKKKYGDVVVSSEPEITSVYYSYNGDAFAPPTMANPPLKVIDSQKDNVTLEWREQWYEVISTSISGTITKWSHEVWAEANGDIYNQPGTGRQYFTLIDNSDVMDLRDFIGTTNFDNNYTYREIDLGEDPYGISDVKYDLLRLNYEDVEKELSLIRETNPVYSLDDYVTDLMEKEEEGKVDLNWKTINPTTDDIDENLITYNETSLQPNKLYLFLLKPYRELENGDILMSYYPASVIASTPEDSKPLEPTPIVPYLEIESGYSDMEVTLIWDYDNSFEYDIMYSTIEEISGANSLSWSINDDYDEDEVPSYIEDYKLVVDDLFPDTTYYFWIKARSKANGTESKWSSAVMGTTADLETPQPPKGVGEGSTESIKKHGLDEPVGEDYITIEWILDNNDYYNSQEEQSGQVKKDYSYILEVADNPIFLDAIRVEITDSNVGSKVDNVDVLDKNLVKVNNLITNRIYYIRMKTKVTVTGSDSETPIIKESNKYSPAIFLITTKSGKEYDGNIDPSKEILPDEDYEIIYDKDKNQLKYRFLSGDGDNNVDQRLIAEIINNHLTDYVIDVRNFKNQPIDSWVIEVPDTIIQAFQVQQIEMVIDAQAIAIEFPSNTFKMITEEGIYYGGNSPNYTILINKEDRAKQKYNQPDSVDKSLSNTFKVNINVSNDIIDYDINYTEEKFTVKIKPDSRYEFVDKEADAYVYNEQKKIWSRTNGILEKEEGLVSFNTGVVGSYGIFATENSVNNLQHWSETYRKDIIKHYNITGYEENYNPDNKVSTYEVMNVALGLINEKRDLDMSLSLSQTQINQLTMSRLLKDPSRLTDNITRKYAVETLLKAYELKNGQPIYAPPSEKNNELAYKAYSIGMLSKSTLDRPDDLLTYGELFFILNAFIE